MSSFSWGFCSGMTVSLIFAFILTYILQPDQEFALDVYRGKTTLEITYRDSVAIDSTVVYKVK